LSSGWWSPGRSCSGGPGSAATSMPSAGMPKRPGARASTSPGCAPLPSSCAHSLRESQESCSRPACARSRPRSMEARWCSSGGRGRHRGHQPVRRARQGRSRGARRHRHRDDLQRNGPAGARGRDPVHGHGSGAPRSGDHRRGQPQEPASGRSLTQRDRWAVDSPLTVGSPGANLGVRRGGGAGRGGGATCVRRVVCRQGEPAAARLRAFRAARAPDLGCVP
jgi:hypothetical protein